MPSHRHDCERLRVTSNRSWLTTRWLIDAERLPALFIYHQGNMPVITLSGFQIFSVKPSASVCYFLDGGQYKATPDTYRPSPHSA